MARLVFFILTIIFSSLCIKFIAKYRKDPQIANLTAAGVCAVLMLLTMLFSGSIFCWLVPPFVFMCYSFYQFRVNKEEWARLASIVCSALAIFFALCSLMYEGMGCERRSSIREMTRNFMVLTEARNRVLGEFLLEKHAGEKILALYWETDTTIQNGLSALRTGGGGRLDLVEVGIPYPEYDYEADDGAGSMKNEYTLETITNILAKNSGCKIIILYAGLPETTSLWQISQQGIQLPKLVLLDTDFYDVGKEAFQDGRVAALIASHPTPESMPEIGTSSHHKTFKEYYTLLHAGNIDAWLARDGAN